VPHQSQNRASGALVRPHFVHCTNCFDATRALATAGLSTAACDT